MRANSTAALAMITFAAACGDPILTVTPDQQFRTETLQQSALRTVTLATIGALASEDERRALIIEMRRSPWVEHKIRFHQYLSSPQGASFLAAAAESVGLSEHALLALSRRLPALDFYVPEAETRHVWQGEGPILVASTLEPGTVFMGATNRQTLIPAADVTRSDYSAVIVMHAAEPRAHRLRRTTATVADNVISPTPGRSGGLKIIERRAGRIARSVDIGRDYGTLERAATTLSSLQSISTAEDPCGPEPTFTDPGSETLSTTGGCVGGGGPGSGSYHWTAAPGFMNFWIRDGEWQGKAEVELKFWPVVDGVVLHDWSVTFQFYEAEPGDVFINENGCPTQFEPGYYAGCWDVPRSIWSAWAPDGPNDVMRLELMEIDGNGWDELFHVEDLDWSADDLGWIDSIWTLDKCHDDSGIIQACAGGSIRFIPLS